MNDSRIRSHLLGERLRTVPLAFTVGFVAAIALELFLAVLGTGPGFAVLTVVAYLVVGAALTRLVLRWSGGLITAWAAAFPAMYAFAWRLFSFVGMPPTGAGQFLQPAVELTLGVGTALYVLGVAVRWVLREVGVSPASEEPAEAGVAGSVRRNRRAVLLGGLGGTLIATAGVGHALGWWCRAEPADCTVENGLQRAVDVQISVRRDDTEVFSAAPHLGTWDRATSTREDGAYREARFEEAVPLGCSLPATVTVDVETGDRSVTETVTFPDPELTRSESLMGSTLFVEIRPDAVEMEAGHSIAIA
ncbi:hypothetical protein [Halosimplex salinum]|uniref:hypothetical protein n=1 Tax=Halosimplex salinum TaxID=1710538 RepID=UPI000F485057|nr:hypothetical protein [Halosimplex salinum]